MIQLGDTRGASGAASLPPRLRALPTLLGLAVMMLGLVVMCGWLIEVRQLVEFHAGNVAMVFNTALCFALAGAGVALPGILRRPMGMFQNVVGGIMVVLCALVLAEYVTDRDLGVDWGFLHLWLHDGNIRPGRLAPNTAIGFMLAGSCLILLPRIAGKIGERVYQILMFALMGIGLTGLVGYVISPDQLFGWARSGRMALQTAVGMIVLALALWSSWYHSQRGQGSRFFGPDERISFLSGAILCVAILTAGLTGFVFQQTILEAALRDKLQFRLDGQRDLMLMGIRQARLASAHVEHDPEVIARAMQATAKPEQPAVVAELQAELAELIVAGFRSAALVSLTGRTLYRIGENDGDDAWNFPFSELDQQAATLVWDGGIVLRTSALLSSRGTPFARLVLSRRLKEMEAQIVDLHGLGTTGEIVICGGRPATLACLPSGHKVGIYVVSRTNIAQVPLPMSYAVNGGSGLLATLDYKGNNVMAAYAPLARNLGLVVKQDTAELYSAVRTQLKLVMPALLLLLVGGVILMRMQIRPLVARLISSENHAREQQLEMNMLVGSVAEGIITIDERGLIESFNAAAAGIFGYSPDEVIGKNIQMLMPAGMGEGHANGMRNCLRTGERKVIGHPNLELSGLRKDGSQFTLELTVNELKFETRRMFVGVMRDITERKQVEATLLQLAQYDTLTGLPNRALFMDRLSNAVLRANRNASAFAVLFLDLDGFKKINDTMGHHSGDELLRKFGERLGEVVRKSDTVARLAGDEFTIILEGINDPQRDARAVADKILAAMQQPFALSDGPVMASTSIGMAVHTEGSADADQLLRRADDAMYRAKYSGKNRWSD